MSNVQERALSLISLTALVGDLPTFSSALTSSSSDRVMMGSCGGSAVFHSNGQRFPPVRTHSHSINLIIDYISHRNRTKLTDRAYFPCASARITLERECRQKCLRRKREVRCTSRFIRENYSVIYQLSNQCSLSCSFALSLFPGLYQHFLWWFRGKIFGKSVLLNGP